jgi:hypothetical protein
MPGPTLQGAPETVEGLLTAVPAGYAATHKRLAAEGARVLALAAKPLAAASDPSTHKSLSRRDIESGLTFVGFALFSCPIKREVKTTAALRITQAPRICICLRGVHRSSVHNRWSCTHDGEHSIATHSAYVRAAEAGRCWCASRARRRCGRW